MKQQRRDQTGMNMLREYGKDLAKWGLLYAPAFSLVVTLLTDDHGNTKDVFRNWLRSVYIGEVVLIFCLTMSYLVSYGEALIFRHYKRPLPDRSSLFHALRSMIFMLPGLYIAFATLELLAPRFGIRFIAPTFASYKHGIVVGFCALAVWILYDLYTSKKESDKKILQLERDHLNAKVSTLSAQMNPHLLFNALNTVAATIHENPDAAEDMTVELAGLYRKTLEATRSDFHPLGRELDLVRAYLAIEKSRFGQRLTYSVSAPGEAWDTVEVPTFLVQPLVENAVKHGIAPLANGGSVDITLTQDVDTLIITIADNGIGFGQSINKGSGTSLENCRRRLELVYGDGASFDIGPGSGGTGTCVRLRLPLHLPANVRRSEKDG
jgi:sensor histidine kinase YesM